MADKLEREDYIDPQCPFCTDAYQKEPVAKRIPIARVIDKLDEHLSRNDYSSAKRHLTYWLEEARLGHDTDGELSVLNEFMGLSRKLGEREAAYEYAEAAVALMEKLALFDHVSGATTYLNAATVYKKFDDSELALKFYKKAQAIYERELSATDTRLGALYNNMGLATAALGHYDEARRMYDRALEIMVGADSFGEAAITCLNIADLICEKDGIEDGEAAIGEWLDRAEGYLDDEKNARDGNYAFICEKCASVFGYYGRFFYENELKERSREIYERN